MKKKSLDILSFKEALNLALNSAPITKQIETVLLNSALGRVLAEDIYCKKSLPSFNNSAMDGFAINSKDNSKRFKIVATILAGDNQEPILKDGTCYKIMTGAKVPDDADTIIPIEECKEVTNEYITLSNGIKAGQNLRKKGEEKSIGELLISKGERLSEAHIALLSAQGILAIRVFAPLKIAILSTGNEIKEPWQEASEDEIYNANAFGISSLLNRFGFNPSYIGAISDNLKETKEQIANLKGYDAIITTGAISMGEADFLKEAYLSNGLKPLFHGVNVKPGRPTMMGLMQDSFIMAMPGNPLTTMVNTLLLSIPILFKMQGAKAPHFIATYAINGKDFKIKSNRTNLVLGDLQNGKFFATRDNRVGSGMLTPLSTSKAIAIFDEGRDSPKEGELIKVILLNSSPEKESFEAINS